VSLCAQSDDRKVTHLLGNGCVNDFSRTLSTHVWEPLIPESAITIFSGGTEGVLCPHVTFIVQDSKPTGLQAAAGRTRKLEPHEIGTSDHAAQVVHSVQSMLKESGISKENVHLVLIKCPLLTSAKVEMIKAASKTPVTTDTYESMAKSRHASAVGIAVALDEMESTRLEEQEVNNKEEVRKDENSTEGTETEGGREESEGRSSR